MTTDSTILRLRKANPVPQPASVDEADLFDRITALEPDSRLEQPQTRATRHRRRRGLVLVLAAFAVAVLASTAFAISNWLMGDVVEPPVTRAEYVQAQKQLTLPPGYSWPKLYIESNSVTAPGAGGGHAVLVAQSAWQCYWVEAIRDGDTAAQERAHRQLETLLANNVIEAPAGASENWSPPNPPTVPYVVFAHDGGLAWIRQTYALAAAGQPQQLIDSCRASAPR
jgi:hypothetical protein